MSRTLASLNNINRYLNTQQHLENNSRDRQCDSKSHNQLPTSKIPENPFCRRILIVDDDADVTLTFRSALENDNNNGDGVRIFEVYTYNDPLLALSDFKQNFYDLMLLDINMPKMNGFEFCEKILKLDINVKTCFMSAAEINHEALREIHPGINIGCFIKKPIAIGHFINRIKTELD
jgi:CheY-like chemotaxis protein